MGCDEDISDKFEADLFLGVSCHEFDNFGVDDVLLFRSEPVSWLDG